MTLTSTWCAAVVRVNNVHTMLKQRTEVVVVRNKPNRKSINGGDRTLDLERVKLTS